MYFVLVLSLLCYADNRKTDNVDITTGQIQTSFCDNGMGLATAVIHVPVIFENRGKTNLILPRNLGPLQNVRVISPKSGSLVYSPHPAYYESKRPAFGNTPDDTLFEIVRAGESVSRDFVIGIPISKDAGHPTGGSPPPGAYVISATRSTWPIYSDEVQARKLRKAWKPYGSLVVRPVVIDKIRVSISLPSHMSVCEGQSAFFVEHNM